MSFLKEKKNHTVPPHYLISSIFSSFLFLFSFFISDISSDLTRASSHRIKISISTNRKRLQHTAPLVCCRLSRVPLDETFWRAQVGIVTTVLSRSAEAFETLKRSVSWCFLVLLTSDVFAKHGAGLLTVAPPVPKLCCVFLRNFPPPTDDVHAVQLHVTWWDCAYLNVFAASFCCACAAAEWANEHWVKCRPSCVLAGTGGVPLRSHFRTHWILCTVLWSSVIYSVFVTIQRLTAPQSCQRYSVLIRRLLFISHCRLRWHTVNVGFLLTSCSDEGDETPKMTSEGFELVFFFSSFSLFLCPHI